MAVWIHLKLYIIMNYIPEVMCVFLDDEKMQNCRICGNFLMTFVWILDGTTFFRDGFSRWLTGFIMNIMDYTPEIKSVCFPIEKKMAFLRKFFG